MAQLVEHSVHAVCRGFEPRLRQTSLHKGLSPDTEGNMYIQPLTVLRMSSMYPSSSCTRASSSLVFTRYTPSLWAPWYSPKFCAGTSHNMYVHTSMCMYMYIPQQVLWVKQRATCICACTCISSWLALISVAYCPSAKLSVAKQPTQPQNDLTLNTTLISIHHVQN